MLEKIKNGFKWLGKKLKIVGKTFLDGLLDLCKTVFTNLLANPAKISKMYEIVAKLAKDDTLTPAEKAVKAVEEYKEAYPDDATSFANLLREVVVNALKTAA